MADFNLTKMAVNMYCPGNVVQQDDAGLPSLLVWIPAFKLSDVLNCNDDSTHPAFIVNGKEIPGFYYSKYENVVYNGKAYSLPAERPATSISFDNSCKCCETKGYGWHMSTAAEWAAVVLWCKKNGSLPYGNNNNGKDSRESEYKAIPMSYNTDGTTASVATGTGPLTWSHDRTASGIWDLNGNVWEWQGGLRLVWGELQILANNDAADPDNPQNSTSTCWKAINAGTGALVEPECKVSDDTAILTGNTIKMDYIENAWVYSTTVTSSSKDARSCRTYQATADSSVSDAAKLVLRTLALLPDSNETTDTDGYDGDIMYWSNGSAECMPYRGGARSYDTRAGVFSISCTSNRETLGTSLGFRAAYIPNI